MDNLLLITAIVAFSSWAVLNICSLIQWIVKGIQYYKIQKIMAHGQALYRDGIQGQSMSFNGTKKRSGRPKKTNI